MNARIGITTIKIEAVKEKFYGWIISFSAPEEGGRVLQGLQHRISSMKLRNATMFCCFSVSISLACFEN